MKTHPHRIISSALAARAGIAQLEILHHADQNAANIDHAVSIVWDAFTRLVRDRIHPTTHELLAVLNWVGASIESELRYRLTFMALRGYELARDDLTRTLPLPLLRYVIWRRRQWRTEESLKAGWVAFSRELSEDEAPPASITFAVPEPALHLSAAKQRELFAKSLFAAPSRESIARMLAPFTRPEQWDALGTPADKRMPHELAQMFSEALSGGKTPQEVMKDALPYFEGSRVRARRAARTWSALVATEAKLTTNRELGNLLIGYQIHATRDQNTRPDHAARDGTSYYLEPANGQKSIAEMPRPPLEADGKPAWN
jgi:hypothetical protein